MSKDLSGAQVGMAPKNNVNNPRPDNLRGRNQFPQTYQHLTTDRYGEYSPFYYAKCERGDIMNLQTNHDLHTFTLVSPMVASVKMHKSFIKVPMEAIYPRTWEKQFTIPTQGDDVPNDCRALLDISGLVRAILALLPDISGASLVRNIVLLESLLSEGSLLSRFNIHLNYSSAIPDEVETIDGLFNDFWYSLIVDATENSFSLITDTDQFVYLGDSRQNTKTQLYVSPRRFIEMIRSNEFSFSDSWDSFTYSFSNLINEGFDTSYYLSQVESNKNFINIEPIIAYQLACAQFGTNDHVDFIYSAPLYRDNMQSLYLADGLVFPTFKYNGVSYQYDVFSQHVFDDIISRYDETRYGVDFFLNLFSYQRSLRYGDYFTGVRPQPLAVGEYSAEVVDGNVSAIDITRSIQMQRLLNRVNMVGRKLGDYLTGIFGGRLPDAPKDIPIFLAHQSFDIEGFETNNTGEAQFASNTPNTITSHLRSAENRHAFEIEIAEPCYLIGMNSYETMRIYSKTIDRFAFHHDRYDDFIPEMQYIGDQDVRASELTGISTDQSFGYVTRFMEYKQRYSYASCGFINQLPSWSFITDNTDGAHALNFIDPDYIRSSPSEFDRFYKSLNGYSLAQYFHFIVCHTNITAPYRQMEYSPEILK